MLVRILVGITVCALLFACTDKKAAEHEQTRRQLLEAINDVALADRGFVPQGDETSVEYLIDGQVKPVGVADLAAYRQQKLLAPAKQLEAVIADAPDGEQGYARRLLADLRASRVRGQTHDAILQWAELSGKQATLLRYLAAVQWADSRQRRLTQDDPAERIRALRENKALLRADVEGLDQQVTALRGRVDQLTAKIDEHHRASGDALARSQQLQAEAMTAQGEQRYTFYQQATEQQRLSDRQAAEAQVLEVQRDVKQGELRHAKVRLDLARQQSKGLDQRLNFEEQRLNQTREKLLEAEAAKAQAVKTMLEYHNQIAGAYAKSVDAVLRSAVEELTQVIALVDQAATGARGARKQAVLLEKLAYLMEQTYVLSNYAMATEDYGHKLSLVAEQTQRVMPEHANSFATKLDQVTGTHREVVDRSAVVIEQARALIVELKAGISSDQSPVALVVEDQAKRLEGYDRRLTGSGADQPDGE